jgi:hypothetical protein
LNCILLRIDPAKIGLKRSVQPQAGYWSSHLTNGVTFRREIGSVALLQNLTIHRIKAAG